MKNKLFDKERELIELINIISAIIEANADVSGKDNRIVDAEGLAIKFSAHLLSTLYLYRGVNLPDLYRPIIRFPDNSSLNVLVRSAFETSLVFYYVFLDPKNENEKDLRYFCWEIAGLYQRQGFPSPSIEENINKLKEEKEMIKSIEGKIKQNPIYLSYSNKIQKRLFQNLKEPGKWRDKSWEKIAISAGYGKLHAKILYGYLCDHAHSGNLSVMQIWQAKDFKERKQLMNSAMGLLLICTAFMIKHYCAYFPNSKNFYHSNYEEPNIVTKWFGIGSEMKKFDKELH